MEWQNFLSSGQIIYDQYQVEGTLGSGGFGDVYHVTDLDTGIDYALKVPFRGGLDTEITCLTQCNHPEFLPPLRFLEVDDHKAFTMELKGISLQEYRFNVGGQLKIYNACLVAIKVLDHLEYLHDHGWIHRDIKPENILLGRSHEDKGLYLIDMSIACSYVNGHGRHLPFRFTHSNCGTQFYMSIRCHQNASLSRRDDLESLAYMLVYLLKGELPWSYYDHQDYCLIKEGLSAEEICSGLPQLFVEFLDYARLLGYKTKPNYHSYRLAFKQLYRITKQ